MIIKAVIFIAVLFVGQRVLRLSKDFDPDQRGYIYRSGTCRNLSPVDTGSEDIDVTSDGKAFISSGLDVDLCRSIHDPRIAQFVGRIYLFDFKHPKKDAVEVALPENLRRKSSFSPHGISIWEDPHSGEIRLFVVNHREGGDTVDILLYDDNTVSFSLVKSVRSKLFASLNDVVAVGPESFYATNDGYYIGCWRVMELLLGLKNSVLAYHDGKGTVAILKGEEVMNSVGISKDMSELYLTRPMDKRVDIYNISKDGPLLKLSRSIQLGVGIDNVFVDPVTGDLWFGAHVSFSRSGDHFSNLDVQAPSQVIRLHKSGPKTDPWESHKIYSPFGDDGEFISASSAAVHYKNKMLIGSVLHKTVYCELDGKPSAQ